MLRIRKLVLAIAAASALSSGAANALVLGELTLHSAQNQPLDAEIELLDVRDLTAAEVAPSLAPAEEFSKAGVPYPAYLQNLTFTPVIIPNGRSVLRVTSSQPLSAPVMRFLVQVMWPQGRLLRDYNVPLNRPVADAPATDATSVAPPVTPVSEAASYTTKRRDTLWQIAARNSQGGSVQQTMLAIQALNPDAFIGNNINQLKTGQVLRLPDQQQIQSIPQGEAIAEVAEQYAAWREGRRLGPRARQLDATRRGQAQEAPARIAQGDNLRLVSPDSQNAAAGAKAVNDQLAVAQESLDTTRRDNEELKSRMSDLQSQLDKLEKLIALKNDQLARLQAQGAAPETATPEAATPEAAIAPPVEQPVTAAAQPPVEPVVAPPPAVVDTAPTAPDEPPAVTEESKGTLQNLLGNPVLLGLIAGSLFLVLLLLLLLLARKRKAEQEAEKHLRMARALEEEGPRDPDFDMPLDADDAVTAPSVTLSPAAVAASAAAAVAAQSAMASVASAVQQDPVVRALEEADQSIAQGQLNQAGQSLEPVVQTHPQRSDARLKLMEVYARQGDQYAFAEHERQLPGDEHSRAEVESLKSRYPAMVAIAAAGVGAATLAAQMDEQYVQELLHEEADSGLTATTAEAPIEPIGAALEPLPKAEAAQDLSLDVAEQTPELNDIEQVPVAESDLDGAFDLSLDDEFSAPEPVAEPPVVPATEVSDDQADADFETLLAQAQLEALTPPDDASSPESATDSLGVDDFADFDLDIAEAAGEPAAVPAAQPATAEPAPTPVAPPDMSDDFDLSLSLDDDSPAARNFATELDDVNAELDKLSQSLESPALDTGPAAQEPDPVDDLDFDFLSGTDEVATKLDLARAYVDMGDQEGARDILDEVIKDGDDAQRKEAQDLLGRLV